MIIARIPVNGSSLRRTRKVCGGVTDHLSAGWPRLISGEPAAHRCSSTCALQVAFTHWPHFLKLSQTRRRWQGRDTWRQQKQKEKRNVWLTHLCLVVIVTFVDTSVLQSEGTPPGCQAAVSRGFLHEAGHRGAPGTRSDSNTTSARGRTLPPSATSLRPLLATCCVKLRGEENYSLMHIVRCRHVYANFSFFWKRQLCESYSTWEWNAAVKFTFFGGQV